MQTTKTASRHVTIPIDGFSLHGDLTIPDNSIGLVLFAHGSGSSRHSPRNQFVASELNQARLATLLFDLLTEEEEALDIQTREFRFDIPLLSQRLVGAIDWASEQSDLNTLNVGLFGASTGAAAALIAAALRPFHVGAVVSRGGRPDLADLYLSSVEAPTLMIVGGDDEAVIQLNETASSQMDAHREIAIVPGATHLFEEPGKLAKVAHLARDWFCKYLPSEQPAS